MSNDKVIDWNFFFDSFLLLKFTFTRWVIKLILIPSRLSLAFGSFLFPELSRWCCELTPCDWWLAADAVISEERLSLLDISTKRTAVLAGVEGSGGQVLLGFLSDLTLHTNGLRKFFLDWVNTAVLTAPQSASLLYLGMPKYGCIPFFFRPDLSHLLTCSSHHKPLILTQNS